MGRQGWLGKLFHEKRLSWMRRTAVFLVGTMTAAALLAGCGAGDAQSGREKQSKAGEEAQGNNATPENEATPGKQAAPENKAAPVTLRGKGEELIALMVEKAESKEYRSLMSTSDEIGEVLGEIAGTDYGTPQSVYQIKISEDMLGLVYEYAGADGEMELSDNLQKDLEGKMVSSLVNILNAQSGTATLAASSIINSGSCFIYPELEQGMVYLYFYDNGYPAAVSFYPEEDGIVTASSGFLMNPDWKGISGTEFQTVFSGMSFLAGFPVGDMEKVEE